DDLRFFFQFHPALQRLSLRLLLPHRWLRRLREMHWPKRLRIKDMDIAVEHAGHRLFLKLERAQFHRLDADDIRLPGGEEPGFLLDGERFADWDAAASSYNACLKAEIFERRWKDSKKEVQVGDILDIPFPIAFQGGNGKDNVVFEFYSAPAFEGDQVFLVHFRDRETACGHFAVVAREWEQRQARFRKESVDAIFRNKGWKVR
ncbi:MAG: hypothetical protein JXO51_05440, partial [Candidatus Aminicenantes bacterium]|nr:hypothetical protein [Candidatus Aminicenantes bacterium]